MRDEVQHVEPRHALLPEQVDGVGAFGLKERGQNVAAVDLFLAAALRL